MAHEILETLFPLIGSKSDIELKENNFLDGLVDVTHNDNEILFDFPEIDILDTPVEIPNLHPIQETDEQQTVEEEDDDSAPEWTPDVPKQPFARKRGPAKSNKSKPISKQSKNQDKESQVPTGEILDVTDYGNAQETSNVAELTKHIRDMEATLKNMMSAIKELHKDVQQIKVQLNNKTTQCIHGPAPQQFSLSIAQPEQLLPQQHVAPLIPAHTQYGAGLVQDEWSFNQSQALNERDYHTMLLLRPVRDLEINKFS